MSKEMSRLLSKNDEESVSAWDRAISDAEGKIAEAQKRIKDLKWSIVTFRQLRDSGEPFPGGGAETFEAGR